MDLTDLGPNGGMERKGNQSVELCYSIHVRYGIPGEKHRLAQDTTRKVAR